MGKHKQENMEKMKNHIDSSLKTWKTRLENTSSICGDFMQENAIKKRGTNQQDSMTNPLNDMEQIQLIMDIFNRCHNVKIDGQKEILLDLKNGEVQHIERNAKNFLTIIKMTFRNATKEGFETINLPKLFEVIKTKNAYSFRTSRSIFHKQNRLTIDESKKELINELKINYDFNIADVPSAEYTEIVDGINEHWKGLIPLILNHIVAGKFVSDKKNLWLLIMAESNFGKSKLFKWIEPFGGSAFMDFRDLTSTGISDKSPDELEGKMCLVIDEVTSFHRKLFEVEDYLMVRPMRNHSIKVPINSRILLSADGGTFNNEYMDKQIINRVAVIDLRGDESKDLGSLPITNKYGRYKIQLVMTHWLYTQLLERLIEYSNLNHIDRADKADNTIQDIFAIYKQQKDDFFEITEKSIREILESPKNTLDGKHFEILMPALIPHIDEGIEGYIIKRPEEIVKAILTNYDKSLEYELKYKSIKQIEAKIVGARQHSWKVPDPDRDHIEEENKKILVRGLFIPKEKQVKSAQTIRVNSIKQIALKHKQTA